jgi:transcriptional regulator with XRE-family HTH domain
MPVDGRCTLSVHYPAMQTLESWMKDTGTKDEALSLRLGVSRVQVLRLRRRLCRPSVETARKLEQITEIPAGDLMMVEVVR